MITLAENFAASMAAEVTTLAFCWRLSRMDGVTLGFTSHDRDLEIDGLIYRSMPGIAPSAVHLSGGFQTDSMDIAGALTADAITQADLAAGRYDGATVKLFMVDWDRPDMGQLPLMRGQLGSVSHSDAGFTAELRGPAHVLDQPVLDLISPECRAQLGDQRCRVDMAGRTICTRIAEVMGLQTLRVAEFEPTENAYGYGMLRFLSGGNSGLDVPLLRSAGDVIYLSEPPAMACGAGDWIIIRQGCDKRFSTCRTRFANALNFQGEPHVPGNDLLTRYPGL